MPDTKTRPRVLLVEDHQDTRVMYATLLEDYFEVALAADGEQALTLLRTARPDIVITDLALPGIDGVEVMAYIRRNVELGGIPIICLSGFDDDEHVARATAAGATRVLRKPCLPDTLGQVVLELLSTERGSR